MFFGVMMLGSRKSKAATGGAKPNNEGADGLPDPETPQRPQRPIRDRPSPSPSPSPSPAPAPAPGPGPLPEPPPRAPGRLRPRIPGLPKPSISANEKDVRDQARAHNLGPTDIIGDPGLNHRSIWLSDDCTRYLIGRDYLPSLPFGGEYYNPGGFWTRFAPLAPPNMPKQHPNKSTLRHFLAQTAEFEFGGYDCIYTIPQPEDYANEEDYKGAVEAWANNYPELAEFMLQLEIVIYFDMMEAMKADDIEKYYAWRELWHHPDDALFKGDNQWSSQYLADVADRAYRKAHPNDPYPIPSASHPSAAKWNRILNYVNDYRNAYYGA